MTMTRHPSRDFHTPLFAQPALIVLLATVYWLTGAWPVARGSTGYGQPQPDLTHFEKVKKRDDEQRQKDDETLRRVGGAAQPHIDAQAQARGGAEKARRERGASLADLNARLSQPAGQAAPADTTPGP